MRYRTSIQTLFISLLVVAGCSSSRVFTPPLPIPDDRSTIEKPSGNEEPNDITDALNSQLVDQGTQAFDLSRQLRNLFGAPKEAMNINAMDEVDDCSWYTNRNAQEPMSLEKIKKGQMTGIGPDTSGTWTIIRAKATGVTPGFAIKDKHGDKYFIKFDPPGFAGLNSGADVIGSKLFYACGYYVPENSIVHFHPSILKMGSKVKFLDAKGRKRYMNKNDLKEILEKIEIRQDGTIRALASKYIEGEILGPFSFRSTRKDDPNDIIPHEHRRELRGLRVIAAWLNHIDAKGANSLDAFYTDPQTKESYVRHSLIDFGTILGSGGRGPHPVYRGFRNEFDPMDILLRIFTLGFYQRGWEVDRPVLYPSVGRFDNVDFHPQKWEEIFPNYAFANMTMRDAYWGAKIVMSFTENQIRAAVETGELPDVGADDYLVKTLVERQKIIGNYYFSKVAPIDRFLVLHNGNSVNLAFQDLSETSGLSEAGKTDYRYRLFNNSTNFDDFKIIGSSKEIELSKKLEPGSYTGVELQLRRDGQTKWSPSVYVYLYQENKGVKPEIIGIKRNDKN